MIENIHNIKKDYFHDKIYDVCIIGSGFAGITAALKLDKKLNILLLEGGDLDYTRESQDMYKGTNTGHEYWDLDASRARYFGGTSNYWGGWCTHFIKEVFEGRTYVKNSEWPIKKHDLDPYLNETFAMFGIKNKFFSGDIKVKGYKYFQHSKLIEVERGYFLKKHKEDVASANNIECYYNANLIDMKMSKSLNNITCIYIEDYKNRKFVVKSKVFILAAGGIENARLMLNFNKECKLGIGNDNNLVGKYFTEHPHYDVGSFLLNDNEVSYFKDTEKKKIFRTKSSFEEKENILSCTIELHDKSVVDNKNIYQKFKDKLRDVICENEYLLTLASDIRNKKLPCFSTGFEFDYKYDGLLRTQSEQMLNYDSAISLNNEKDALGLRRINLHWDLLAIDKDTIQKSLLFFGARFANLEIGRVKLNKWVVSSDDNLPGFPNRLGGPHHMCTTRMGFSKEDGVVDLNQKVFGVDNLYIAGSSVFSTGGSVNPTFTIVQMTIRLADYLNKEVFNV